MQNYKVSDDYQDLEVRIMFIPNHVDCPALDIDTRLAVISPGWRPTKERKQEQRIVANLINFLDMNGWKVVNTHDGDQWVPTPTAKEVLELVFNLDESHVSFRKKGKVHNILLINGNGIDIVADYSFSLSGSDDFEELMEAFEPAAYL